MTDPDAYQECYCTPAVTTRRYIAPAERRRRREALVRAAGEGLGECLRVAAQEIIRNVHVREDHGQAVIELLTDDPIGVVAALESLGFSVERQGFYVRAWRTLRTVSAGR